MIPVMAAPSLPFAMVEAASLRTAAGAWYGKALTALWDAGLATGVDPVVLAAQCALETNWGRFGGAITAEFNNTCGLKTVSPAGDRPEDHQRFPADLYGRPWLGALAHAHHLRLYCGFPVPGDTPDPRAKFVGPGTAGFNTVRYVTDLSGRWAPGADYGAGIARIIGEFAGT
jgi:hypothetical protein